MTFYSTDILSEHQAIRLIMEARNTPICSGNRVGDHLIWEGRITESVRAYMEDHQLGEWLKAHEAEHRIECSLFSYKGDYRLVVYVTLFDEVLASAFSITWC